MLTSLYETTVRAATPLIESHLKKRAARGKEDAARAPERHGKTSRPREAGPLVWFHAASVGESLSLLSIIGRLLAENSALQVMVTTGTVTSAKLMADRLPARAFHQYMPVDHPDWAAAFLDHWKPDLIVWAESDFWPAMLFAVRRRKIPTVLLNARMSESTFCKWKLAKPFMRHVLEAFDLCLAQNEDEARRLRALGGRNVKVSANLKYAAAPLPFDQAKLDALKAAVGSRPLVLWASTHPGEEDIACRLHLALKKENPGLLSVIVPRHPARGKDLKTSISAQGLNISLRSEGAMPSVENDVYLADTLGEMGLFYRLSKLAIVAGSFADVGGHNPIEPGQTGCVIFYGPQVYNFITICADFESRNAALRVKDENELHGKVKAYLANPAGFVPMADAALAWTGAKSHILDEVASDLAPWLERLKKQAIA